MNVIGHTTLMAAQRGSNVTTVQPKQFNEDGMLLSPNMTYTQQQYTRPAKREGKVLVSPNQVTGRNTKTTKASLNTSQDISKRLRNKRTESANKSTSRGRSRSNNQKHFHTDNSVELKQNNTIRVESKPHGFDMFNQRPATDKFHSVSHTDLAEAEARRRNTTINSNQVDNSLIQRRKGSANRKRSISAEPIGERKLDKKKKLAAGAASNATMMNSNSN